MIIVEPTLAQDLAKTVERNSALLMSFKKKTVVITGATGLVGHVLALTFLVANERLNLDVKVIAMARNEAKATRVFGLNKSRVDLSWVYQDIETPISIEPHIDFIFHTAAITTSRQLIAQPVEAFTANILGMQNIMRRAQHDDARVVYLSSMEVYGQPFTRERATEADVGYVDPLMVRNGYPESKRANEFLASAYYHEYGVSVVNARLAQTFGPGVATNDSRVFAQFARSAVAGEALVLHTDGSSMGNYCYLPDTISGLITLAVKGASGESYNIVNEATTVTIKQLAQIVANNFGNGRVVIDIPDEDLGYAPKVQLKLSGKKLEKLGWEPTAGLVEMFQRTLQSWQS